MQNLGFFGDMVLSVLNGMMNAGGEYDDNLYLTAKVKVRGEFQYNPSILLFDIIYIQIELVFFRICYLTE